jgi:hypothetical protein
MTRFMAAWTVAPAFALAVSVSAQDTTTKTRTQVKVDDGRVLTMTGCLSQGASSDTFILTGPGIVSGDETKTKTRTRTEVDKNDMQTKSRTATTVQESAVGTAGITALYELTPRAGFDLASHVGHTVTVSAIALDPRGDDKAKVSVEEKARVKRDDAPETTVETKTKVEVPRGAQSRLSVVSVTHVSPSCTM